MIYISNKYGSHSYLVTFLDKIILFNIYNLSRNIHKINNYLRKKLEPELNFYKLLKYNKDKH